MSTQAQLKIIDYAKLEAMLPELRQQYINAEPFPHIVLEQLINPEIAAKLEQSFPVPSDPVWLQLKHVNERKLAHNDISCMPSLFAEVINELNSDRFVKFLIDLTTIEGMFPDKGLEGGGMHQIEPGGFLNIHADFTVHPYHRMWKRRVNLLLYLNSDWKEEYNGHLELWDKKMHKCAKKVLPVINRCVIFNTDFDSFHGHPEPLKCPPGRTRKSIALYYFTMEKDKPVVRSTEYKPRPGEGKMKAAMIYADKIALRCYDRTKRVLGIKDKTATKVLGMFSRKNR